MNKNALKGNLTACNFFYYLEKDNSKSFFTKEEITNAIKKAINEELEEKDVNKD